MNSVHWDIRDDPSRFNCLRVFIFGDNSRATHALHLVRPLKRLRKLKFCALRYTTGPLLEAGLPEAPLGILRREWSAFRPDVAIISRYYGRNLNHLLRLAKEFGTPLVAHMDDDFLSSDETIRGYSPHLKDVEGRIAAVSNLISKADLLYVPTPTLAERFKEAGATIPVEIAKVQSGVSRSEIKTYPLGNALTSGKKSIRIGYMGSRGHSEDLRSILNEVGAVLDEIPDSTFHTFGTIAPPRELKAFFKCRIVHHDVEKDYNLFLRKLASLRWDVGLAPLIHTQFNVVKTHTKWVEYTAAGIPVVASRSVVYDDVCADGRGFLAGEDEWLPVLRRAVGDHRQRKKAVRKAQGFVRRHCLLSHMESQLLELFAQAGVSLPPRRRRLLRLLGWASTPFLDSE